MKDVEPFCIGLSSEDSELIRTAFNITGKVNITKENPIMKIKIKGTLILDFSSDKDNQILELTEDE